ncbi:MAG: DUF6973 domain-containing protein [Bacteroidia bacterium]
MKLSATVIFILCQLTASAQLGKLSCYEKRWALIHPFAALKVKKLYSKNAAVYAAAKNDMALDRYESGGRLDAFRHSFFMAVFAQRVSVRKLRKLGKAHEKGNYRMFRKHRNEYGELPDSLASVMDLHNNELGFTIGVSDKHLPADQLAQKVTEALKKGEGVYLKRNSNGQYVDCDNKILDPETHKKKWFVPKCLIKTNN